MKIEPEDRSLDQAMSDAVLSSLCCLLRKEKPGRDEPRPGQVVTGDQKGISRSSSSSGSPPSFFFFEAGDAWARTRTLSVSDPL